MDSERVGGRLLRLNSKIVRILFVPFMSFLIEIYKPFPNKGWVGRPLRPPLLMPLFRKYCHVGINVTF